MQFKHVHFAAYQWHINEMACRLVYSSLEDFAGIIVSKLSYLLNYRFQDIP